MIAVQILVPFFALRPHMGSITRMDPKPLLSVGTCPALPRQLLAQDHSDMPEPPTK